MPEVVTSVVVATHNSGGRLDRLARVLAEQSNGTGFELVIVDDASTDGTADALDGLDGGGLPVRVIKLEENVGPATARNVGWRAARGRQIVFTDDDCVPQEGWLTALSSALADTDVVQGRTIPEPTLVREIGPFGHSVEVKGEDGFYETCNIAYRREVLEEVGGFDERFRYPFGEDSDLAWRAKKAGFSSAFVPDALVIHDVQPSDFVSHLKRLRRRDGLVLAMKRHPELRRTYTLGTFFSPTHPWAIALAIALGALAAKPSSRLRLAAAGVLAAGYARQSVRTRRGPMRRRHWAGVVPLSFIADLTEVGVLARASARYRTLFL